MVSQFPELSCSAGQVVDRCRDLAPQGLATCLWGLAALRPPNARPGWLEVGRSMGCSVSLPEFLDDLSFQRPRLWQTTSLDLFWPISGSEGTRESELELNHTGGLLSAFRGSGSLLESLGIPY